MSDTSNNERDILEMTARIVAAYVSNNHVASEDLQTLIANTRNALAALREPQAEEEAVAEPAVPVRRSITPDYLVCLEDGKKLKMLKRYLRTRYGMTPDDYRRKWNLPPDYPMVAPSYAAQRAEFARSIGLGKKSGGDSED
ncbi:MAG: MucR family transcriptional regulator [Pseudomonadota bacterium]|nr:MucR family transcriptional regulator [Pseudomonadota bacterium]